jgi:hypothetical protein
MPTSSRPNARLTATAACERGPDRDARRDDAEGAEDERHDRGKRGLDDRGLPAADPPQLREGEALAGGDARPDAVRVDVREPEDDRRDDDEHGDEARLVGVGLRPQDDHREHDERAVDETRKAVARRFAAPAHAVVEQHPGHRRPIMPVRGRPSIRPDHGAGRDA